MNQNPKLRHGDVAETRWAAGSGGPGATTSPADLAIVIVSWNARDHLRRCLQSLQRTRPAHLTSRITVVDNASDDGSLAMVQHEFAEVETLRNIKNLGFARANNLALRQTSSPYVCLLNSDVVVHTGCFEKLLNYLVNHPLVGLVGPQLLNPDGSPQPSCYGHPTYWNTFCHALGFAKRLPGAPLFNGMYGKYGPRIAPRQVDVLSGCFWVIRQQALQQVGLLDEYFFIYWEDFDYCKRCRDLGWQIAHVPAAKATHHGGASSATAPVKFIIETERANLRYWRKHHGLAGMLYIAKLIFVRHTLRVLLRALQFTIQPGSRTVARRKIKQSLATLAWLSRGGAIRKVSPK